MRLVLGALKSMVCDSIKEMKLVNYTNGILLFFGDFEQHSYRGEFMAGNIGPIIALGITK